MLPRPGWKPALLCKGLCHCGRQRDGDAYRMQMGVDVDGDEWDCRCCVSMPESFWVSFYVTIGCVCVFVSHSQIPRTCRSCPRAICPERGRSSIFSVWAVATLSKTHIHAHTQEYCIKQAHSYKQSHLKFSTWAVALSFCLFFVKESLLNLIKVTNIVLQSTVAMVATFTRPLSILYRHTLEGWLIHEVYPYDESQFNPQMSVLQQMKLWKLKPLILQVWLSLD